MTHIFRIAIGVTAAIAGFTTLIAQELRPEAIYADVVPSIGTIRVEKADGTTALATAFLALQDGVAITAWHVVNGAKRALIKFSNGEEFESSGIIDKDVARDVALIRVKGGGRKLLRLAKNNAVVGSRAYVVGSPQGLDFTISDGLVSQIQTVGGSAQIQFSCPASPGNSGSPLLNAYGEVLGVVSWQVVNGQNLNFATPVVYASRLDATLPTTPWQDLRSTAQNERSRSADSVPPKSDSVLVVGYRTAAHRERSSPEVFQQVMDGLLLYMRSSRVSILEASLRPMAQATDAPSIYNLVTTADRAGASAVVVITVDRPATSWVKVSIEAYDVAGKKLWTESDRESSGITSRGKIEKALRNLENKLSPRLGSVALPLRPPE